MSSKGAPASSLVARICGACVQSVPVTGASVSLMTGTGNRATVYASDGVSARLEDLQFDLGEGPGIDAFGARQPVLVADLGDPRRGVGGRWPAFTPAAWAAGARAVFAFPLLLGAARLGVLLLYRDRPEALDSAQLGRALRLADGAFFALFDQLAGSIPSASGEVDREWHGPDVALHRAQVYQAAGMLTVDLGVSIEEAMVRLRAHSFASDRPVADVAADIVGRILRLEEDNGG
ncbi:MAG TPA: GAF and ANTAR domain-containing protein [Mycobacterium sp.]